MGNAGAVAVTFQMLVSNVPVDRIDARRLSFRVTEEGWERLAMECTLEEAQEHIGALIEIVVNGGRITVTKGGLPVATIQPIERERKPFPFGLLSHVGPPPEGFFEEPCSASAPMGQIRLIE